MLAPAAMAQGTQPQANTACSELASGDAEATQQQAQAFLNENPSDPNNFDANGNGVACEYTTPTPGTAVFEDESRFSTGAQAAPPAEGNSGSTSGGGNLNCVDISTGDAKTIQEEAQALLNENPNGPAQNLDANGNGIACEYTTSVASGTDFEDGSGFISGGGAAPSAEEPSGEQYSNGGSNGDTEGGGVPGGTLPDTGGASLFALAGGALLLGGGLLARRIIH